MKYLLILILPPLVIGLLLAAAPLLLIALPYLIYDRRCKMVEKLQLGDEAEEEKGGFFKNFSVNEWAKKLGNAKI